MPSTTGFNDSYSGVILLAVVVGVKFVLPTKLSNMTYLKELKTTYSRKRVDDDLLNKPVETPEQVYDLFRYMQDETKEKVVCLHLNTQLEILSYEVVAIGTAHNVLVDAVSIYRGAIVIGASSIIVIHNHPSGSKNPSSEDKFMAKEIAQIGKLHKIPLNDFIIIGEDGYCSFEYECIALS